MRKNYSLMVTKRRAWTSGNGTYESVLAEAARMFENDENIVKIYIVVSDGDGPGGIVQELNPHPGRTP